MDSWWDEVAVGLDTPVELEKDLVIETDVYDRSIVLFLTLKNCSFFSHHVSITFSFRIEENQNDTGDQEVLYYEV
tara:strand:- start:26 stop:250 length:225 start_codon:yes stop_codon:yes gene_type:complete